MISNGECSDAARESESEMEMTNKDSFRARLVELALTLSGATQLKDILDLSINCLERSYPGTRWAILDQVAPARYRATSRAVAPEGLRSLMGSCAANASLSVQELRDDPGCILGDPPHYSSQIIESNSEFPELIVGAWRVIKRKNGEPLPVNDVCRLVGGALKAKRELEWLRNQSIIDELTQIPNRRGIMEHLGNEEIRVQRYGGSLSVLFVDLNYFKEINDTYGHKAGDLALRTCAKTLQKVLRASDYVGRLGGDEFLGILPGVDIKEANSVAERMKQELEQTSLTIGTDTIYLQASIGVASISEGLSGLELLEKADERMYYSKRRFRRVQSLTSLETSRRVANRLSQMV